MMRLSTLLAGSFLFLNLSCAQVKVADFKAGVTLPYSEDCFFVNVISKKEIRYPKLQCEAMKKRSLIIMSEDYKLLRKSIQENCQVAQCKQLVGQFDQLFLTIDKSLQLVPWK